jgi:hypothetical protein
MKLAPILLVAATVGLACSKRRDEPASSAPPSAAPAPAPSPTQVVPAPHGPTSEIRTTTGVAPGATAGPTAGADGRTTIGKLSVAVPEGWAQKPISGGMRKAAYDLPAKAGADAPELVVYHFGQGGAGSVEANLERWYGQFVQADGRPSKEAAKVERFEAGGMPVTLVDVAGRYVAAMQPGAADKHDKPGYRMLAAIVEAADGAYYFKLVGSDAAVADAVAPFTAMIRAATAAP